MFKLITTLGGAVIVTGVLSSTLKRYTTYDSQKMVLDRLENENVKHYVEKYFDVSDTVVIETENAGKKIGDKVRSVLGKD